MLVAVAAMAPAAHAADDQARYALAGGCYTLKAGGADVTPGGPYRMQATDLGWYLFYDKDGKFLANNGGDVAPAKDPSPDSDWRIDSSGDGFKVALPAAGKSLAAQDGKLVLADEGSVFTFAPADGCPVYPESETNVTGTPHTGKKTYSEVRGYIDAHIHMMAFEFLGGSAHCARPWSRYGAPYALVDCPDHGPNGSGAVLEDALVGGKNNGQHDTVGWPTFKDWPAYYSLTHEQTYYKWLERAWRGGLRVYVNLLVDNGKLCEAYPIKRNPCDEMNTVRLEMKDTYALQDYIDAQNGGPGKGWFRIVRDPFEARRVINEGKLAVVLGIENSRLFECREQNDVPQCDRATIDREMDEMYAGGVRDMEIVNKFDNGLTGVAGDNGTTGVVVNNGQKLESNHYWDMKTCTGPKEESDHEQPTVVHNDDKLIANGLAGLNQGGQSPFYGAPPHCNQRGLTALGEYLIRRMIKKQMIFDPDHMSVVARKQALAILEAEKYSGVVSSHSWSTPDAYPRIYKLGGVITPYAGASANFVKEWKAIKPMRSKRFFWGFGYGADMNGFGSQGPPRLGAKNPVTYPFKSFDGQTVDKQRSGQRTWDINVDGVAHYGLYPDWIEDLRMQAGDEIVQDMTRGSEAYLQMWERTVGVPRFPYHHSRAKVTRGGIGRVRLGLMPVALLLKAGQPQVRGDRAWTYRIGKSKLVAVYDEGGEVALVASNVKNHKIHRVGRLSPVRRVKGAKRFGRGVLIRRTGSRTLVYGVRGKRVAFTGIATKAAAKSPRTLARYLKLAGVR